MLQITEGSRYTVTLKGGVDEPHITNATETPLVADYAWTFIADGPYRARATMSASAPKAHI